MRFLKEIWRSPSQPAWFFSLAVLTVLWVVWPMPGTLALRNILMGLLLLASSIGAYGAPRDINRRPIPQSIWVLLALTAWLIVNTLWINKPPEKGAGELWSQWGTSIVFALSGWFMSIQAYKHQEGNKVIISVIFCVLLTQVLFHDLVDLLYIVEVGRIPFRADPASTWPDVLWKALQGWKLGEMPLVTAPDKFSYVLSLFEAFLVAEFCGRKIRHKKFLPLEGRTLLLAFVLGIVAIFFLSLRNGFLELSIILLVATVVLSFYCTSDALRRSLRVGMIGFFIAAFVMFLSFQADSRWKNLAESVKMGWHTESNQSWLDPFGPLPTLKNGQMVDNSYLRVAWAKEGLLLIRDRPLGSGYNRSAYGTGIDSKYSTDGQLKDGHSHSGLIDFTVANGIPGLLLWLLFNFLLIYAGAKAVKKEAPFLGLLLLFFVVSYNFRSLVDSTIRDHMLQQYLFFVTLLSGMLSSATGMQNDQDTRCSSR